MDPEFYFFTAFMILLFGTFVCFITLVVHAFVQDEAGWGIILLLTGWWCLWGLIPLIYGWMRAGDWDIGLLMIALTVSWVGAIAVVFMDVALLGT